MAYNTASPFTCNIKEFIIDEIALDGLEGVGLTMLWKRLEARISARITHKMKIRCWSFLVQCKCISFYRVPEPLPEIDIIDRLTVIDPETGYLKDPDDYLDGPYEYAPARNANGSAVNYKKRSLVTDEVISLSYDNVVEEYGDKLVMVASTEERWKALAPDLPICYLDQLIPLNYCLLELIGRARENGQMTTGKTNLSQIVKDSKILFYHRKALQDLDLVRVTSVTQVTAGRAIKGLLIRLKRFHKSDIQSVPKSGLIHDLVEYLKQQPNYCEKTDMVINKGLMTPTQNKRFQKKVSIFHFEENPVSSDLVFSSTSKDADNPKRPIKKRYMCLVSKSDESSQSEDEEENQNHKCQYKIGVNVMRQAYERFLEAGRNGLTQYQLAQLVGLEFYVGRTICRIFKSKNIIREFIECKGRQRMGRYIAIAATSKMDSKMAAEKEKFQKLVDEGDKLCQIKKRKLSESSSDSENLIELKRRKQENESNGPEYDITEVKLIDGVRNPVDKKLNLKSKVSLRQLKFANGILKVLHEKSFVIGYQTLSNLVASDCNEPPMDTKAMKLLLQGMVLDGNLKIYRLKLPRSQFQYSIMICAPHMKPTDPLLRAKYKELVHKINLSKKIAQKRIIKDNKPLSQYAYPRYVKVQKLHEALIKIMYFNKIKAEPSDLPCGFIKIKELIPELPVGVALGHISSEGVIDVNKFTIEDSLLDVRVRDASSEIYRALIKSNNLQASLRSSLKILAQFGLVQLVVQSTSDGSEIPDNCMTINMFYVNKRAKIIDTSGRWPRENAYIEELEKEYNFETVDAVKEYWRAVYQISINTTIEVPNRRQKNIQIKPPIRTIPQALALDVGLRFGNGLGPCGFDSIYYLDVPRLWRAYCIRSNSLKSKLKNCPVKIPKFEIPKKKKVQKKKVVKKMKLKKQDIFIPKLPMKPMEKGKNRLRNSKVWLAEEDRLLMMCKTAITIMSPISQPGCLQVRNLVAKDILSINDPKKTQTACHKRASYIESNSTLMHERNCILNELRRHNNIIGKYEGLLKKLRILYSTNMSKYINEARKPMMELVWIIYNISKKLPLMKETPCVAVNLEQFHNNYVIASSANKICNLYKTPHESDICNATLKEAILLTVMLSFESSLDKKSADIIFSYFSKHAESHLRYAIDPLRKSGAIAAKDKLIRAHLQIVDLDDIVHCSYRVSTVYQRKWICRLNADFGDNFKECFFGDSNLNAVKAAPETNCFCFEQLANDNLELVALTVPVITGPSGSIIQEDQLNVIDIATNFKLKSGTIGVKNKIESNSYSNLYKDINLNEVFENLSRQSFISDEDIENKNINTDDAIVTYLMTKREKGATFNELLELLKIARKDLISQLSELQAKKVIKRIGFYENVIILLEHAKPWCMIIADGFVIPVPWLTLDGKIRPNIFLKWAGVVMNKIFEYPCCSLNYLTESCEFLTARAVQDICEMLQKCKCITLHTLSKKTPSLFSEDDDISPVLSEYNEFESIKNIIAKPEKDCFSKYSFVKNFVSPDLNNPPNQSASDQPLNI